MTLTRLLAVILGLAVLAACLPAARPPQPGTDSAITGPAVTTTTLPAPTASTPAKGPMMAPNGTGPLVPTAPRSLPMPAPPKVPAAPVPQPAPLPAVVPAATAPTPTAPATEVAPPEATTAKDATPKTAPPAAPQPAVILDDPQALKCQKKGGQWASVGQAGLHACILPTKDGGKQCKAKTDCQGECLARSGSCSPIAPLFGCNDILTEGGLRVTQCID